MVRSTFADIALDDDLAERVERLAAARHRPARGLLREAVEQYVDREEKRMAFNQDALAAWAEYQTTGLHAGEAEVDAWLARLEAEC